MKVQTEKLPKSLLALDVELDRAQVEKGLDRAARRISQKYNIPGFRKGKAPRFIVENYFGREALVEEAYEDLVNRSFREALEQEKINPIGQANLESVNFNEEPFTFRVTVPVSPTITLPDYRAIRVEAEQDEVTDEVVEQAMEQRREQHVVLREPDDARPAEPGDQLTVQLESFVDGERLEEYPEGEEIPESNLTLEPEKLVAGLYEGLIGIEADETREITVRMPEDHPNEQVRDKDVLFKVKLIRMQERLLPDWEELPVLEEFEGTLDELRARTRTELEEAAKNQYERELVEEYTRQLVEQTEYDIPDALIAQEADQVLEEQGQQFSRYGITLDQMLQYRNQTREQAIEELLPRGEERLKTTLAMREIVRAEQISVEDAEIDAEVTRMLETYGEEEREMARTLLNNQLRPTVASGVLNQKLQERLIAIALGNAPELDAPASAETTNIPDATDTPAVVDDTPAVEPTTEVAATEPETTSNAATTRE